MDLDDQIKIFQEKLQAMLKKFGVVQKENINLKQDLEKCKKNLAEKEIQVEALQQKMDILHMTSTSMDDTSRKELNKRIQTYIDDIEKCIQTLKK
ncbi:MAG: hypothetical protein ABIY35_07970 [Chitinophagaceae bacterium]